MAGWGLNFLDLPPPEEEPAPRAEQNGSNGSNGSSKTPASKSIAAEFLPMLSTAGLESLESDSGDEMLSPAHGLDVLAMACEPPEAFPGVPTHVILRVLKITGLPTVAEDLNGVPGRAGLGYFLEDKDPMQRSTVPWQCDCLSLTEASLYILYPMADTMICDMSWD